MQERFVSLTVRPNQASAWVSRRDETPPAFPNPQNSAPQANKYPSADVSQSAHVYLVKYYDIANRQARREISTATAKREQGSINSELTQTSIKYAASYSNTSTRGSKRIRNNNIYRTARRP
jgi:hypothetical protein